MIPTSRERTRLITLRKKQKLNRLEPQRTPPLETTGAERYYFAKQVELKTHMVVVLLDGEEIHGRIDWQDTDCIKVRRFDGQGIVIRKSAIREFHKQQPSTP